MQIYLPAGCPPPARPACTLLRVLRSAAGTSVNGAGGQLLLLLLLAPELPHPPTPTRSTVQAVRRKFPPSACVSHYDQAWRHLLGGWHAAAQASEGARMDQTEAAFWKVRRRVAGSGSPKHFIWHWGQS